MLLATVVSPQRTEAQGLNFSLFERYLESFRIEAGIPGMSIPAGLAPEDGLPVGFQLLAPAHEDARLYRVGGAIEALLNAQWGGPLTVQAPDLPTDTTEVAR